MRSFSWLRDACSEIFRSRNAGRCGGRGNLHVRGGHPVGAPGTPPSPFDRVIPKPTPQWREPFGGRWLPRAAVVEPAAMDAPGDDGAGTLDSGPTPHQVGAPCALRSPPVRKRPSAPDVDEEMVTKRSAGQPNSRAGDTEARPFDMSTNTEAAAAGSPDARLAAGPPAPPASPAAATAASPASFDLVALHIWPQTGYRPPDIVGSRRGSNPWVANHLQPPQHQNRCALSAVRARSPHTPAPVHKRSPPRLVCFRRWSTPGHRRHLTRRPRRRRRARRRPLRRRRAHRRPSRRPSPPPPRRRCRRSL